MTRAPSAPTAIQGLRSAAGGGFRQGNPFGGGFGGSSGGPGAREFHFSFDDAPGGAAGFEDIFANLMGGGRGARARTRAAKGEDFSAAVTVSFAEAATGGTRRVVLQNGEQIDVKIPVGVKDGQVVRVKGRGGAGRGGGPNGDILLHGLGRAPSLHDPRRQRYPHGPAGDAEGSGCWAARCRCRP